MYKVIIVITTYNLKEYIEEALMSVLNQEVAFPYQIIVADDCSSDGTKEILDCLSKKYRDKLKVISAEKNLGSLANSNRVFDGIDCEYFSFLDGDDVWVGKDRLQKQVDFLDNNPRYMMCAGNTRYLINHEPGEYLLTEEQLEKEYTFDDYINKKMPFFHTSSILVRNRIFCNGLPACFKKAVGTFEECALRGEDFRRILHLEKGPLFAMNDLYSYYRIHSRGIWQGSTKIRKCLETSISYNFYNKYFSYKNTDFFAKEFNIHYERLIKELLTSGMIYPTYSLNEKDHILLSELMSDINGSYGENIEVIGLKKRIIEILVRMIKKLLVKSSN